MSECPSAPVAGPGWRSRLANVLLCVAVAVPALLLVAGALLPG